MHCTNCGAQLNEGAQFCKTCGKPVVSGHTAMSTAATAVAPTAPVARTSGAIIKCGNCGYIGEGEKARKLVFTVLAWMCVIFAPLITALYFVGTHKYRCPKCKSTFIGIRNKEGVFTGQRGGASKVVVAILLILVGLAITGILASIVLVSLNDARQKAAGTMDTTDTWVSFSPVGNQFTILFPTYPASKTEHDSTNDGNTYDINTYAAHKDTSSFDVVDYVYRDPIDVSDPNALLEKFLNSFNNGIGNATIASSNYTTLNTYPALDFLIDTTGDEHVKGMIVLVDNTPYLVAEDYYTDGYIDADYQKFISSFSVK